MSQLLDKFISCQPLGYFMVQLEMEDFLNTLINFFLDQKKHIEKVAKSKARSGVTSYEREAALATSMVNDCLNSLLRLKDGPAEGISSDLLDRYVQVTDNGIKTGFNVKLRK